MLDQEWLDVSSPPLRAGKAPPKAEPGWGPDCVRLEREAFPSSVRVASLSGTRSVPVTHELALIRERSGHLLPAGVQSDLPPLVGRAVDIEAGVAQGLHCPLGDIGSVRIA